MCISAQQYDVLGTAERRQNSIEIWKLKKLGVLCLEIHKILCSAVRLCVRLLLSGFSVVTLVRIKKTDLDIGVLRIQWFWFGLLSFPDLVTHRQTLLRGPEITRDVQGLFSLRGTVFSS